MAAVQDRNDSAKARMALGLLSETYWYPLYAFVRRKGLSPHDAQDLTQGFFEMLFEKDALDEVSQEQGKLRAFLLSAINHFLSNERDRASALKRGGGTTVVSLDEFKPEERYQVEPSDTLDAERLYERRWAMTLLEKALKRIGSEYANAGKAETYEALKSCITAGRSEEPYSEIAEHLGSNEGAIKVAVHRLRKRYRELLRDEIGRTVASPDEIDEEVRYLCRILGQ